MGKKNINVKSIINNAKIYYRLIKLNGLLWFLKSTRLKFFPKKIRGFKKIIPFVKNKKGLEIGGPSGLFKKKGKLPIYPLARTIDNCNYGNKTVWEKNIKKGNTFNFYKEKKGHQYILEATNLKGIKSNNYEFIMSSHVLEHVANPLKAIYEWKRVLKKEGLIIVIVPDKRRTFDNKRKITSLKHILKDYKKSVGEDDLTHLKEILKNHDFKIDSGAKNLAYFKKRSEQNFKNRCLHHHSFDDKLLVKLLDYAGFKEITSIYEYPHHLVIVGKRPL